MLEQAYAVVSALPRRAEDRLHVSLMENYPGTLEALGEPIRQVWTWGAVARQQDHWVKGSGWALGSGHRGCSLPRPS